MRNGYDIHTKFDDRYGTVTQELHSVFNDVAEVIIRRVINTMDQQVRENLIALGWTPPRGS